MSDERDTRVEELRAGDQVRYCGRWFDVVKVRLGLGLFPAPVSIDEIVHRQQFRREIAPYVALDVQDEPGPTGELRTLVFRRSWFVAAECNPRPEAVPA